MPGSRITNLLSVEKQAISRYAQARRIRPLQNQNNFYNRFAYLNKHRILWLGLNETFCGNLVTISECRAEPKFSKCRQHSDFTVCPSSDISSTRKSTWFLESLNNSKNTSNTLKKFKRTLQWKFRKKFFGCRAFSLLKTVPGCRAYSHSAEFKLILTCDFALPVRCLFLHRLL